MSIINGYGSARLDSTPVLDIMPLFDLGYAGFTQLRGSYRRFAQGSQAWIQAMADQAAAHFGTAYTPHLGCQVTAIIPGDGSNTPVVEWETTDKTTGRAPFDMVVSTVDMHMNAELLDNAQNPLWSSLYAPVVGQRGDTTLWPLEPGYCYLHQDPEYLAPGLPDPPLETLQFTAAFAGDGQGGYDLAKTYTTFVQANLVGYIPESPQDKWYLTMYGFDPESEGITPPATEPGHAFNYVHGMLMPTYMVPQKLAFHVAQSVSSYAPPRAKQAQTGLFFAGNNLTMDTEEGALLSGFCIAKYALGIDAMATLGPATGPAPDPGVLLAATLEFDALFALMFPPAFLDSAAAIEALQSMMTQIAQLPT
jgi:hypothetical protein